MLKREGGRERERETDRQTERDRERETETETQREREREREKVEGKGRNRRKQEREERKREWKFAQDVRQRNEITETRKNKRYRELGFFTGRHPWAVLRTLIVCFCLFKH